MWLTYKQVLDKKSYGRLKGQEAIGFCRQRSNWGMGSKKTERRVYVKNRADFDFGENSEMGVLVPKSRGLPP